MDGLVPTELGPLERTPSKADLRALWRDQRPFTVAGRPGVSCLAKLTTITNKPSGVSPADVGPRLNGLPQLLELKRDPLLPKSSSNQDLINAVAPDLYELQRWASRGGGSESVADLASLHHMTFGSAPALGAPGYSRGHPGVHGIAKETRRTQRAVSLDHPLYSRADDLISCTRIQNPAPRKPNEQILRHLRGATCAASLPAPNGPELNPILAVETNDRPFVSSLDFHFKQLHRTPIRAVRQSLSQTPNSEYQSNICKPANTRQRKRFQQGVEIQPPQWHPGSIYAQGGEGTLEPTATDVVTASIYGPRTSTENLHSKRPQTVPMHFGRRM